MHLIYLNNALNASFFLRIPYKLMHTFSIMSPHRLRRYALFEFTLF